jgi:serine phosphatase RsbU (regulator of sigma subunit)
LGAFDSERQAQSGPANDAVERQPNDAVEQPPHDAVEQPRNDAVEQPPNDAVEQPPNDAAEQPPSDAPLSALRAWWLPVATVILGLLVTGALVLVSHAQYTRNEKRLLGLRVRDAAALVAAAVPGIENTLASTAGLANATHGDVGKFRRFTAAYIGTGGGSRFASISLWKLGAPQRGPVAVAGSPPKLALSTPAATAFFARAVRSSSMLSVIGLLQPPGPRLGYAFATPGVPGGFAVYGERLLPTDRRSRLQGSNQFAGLHYALYLGSLERPQNLLVTDLSNPPPHGRADAEAVPFGDTRLTLVMSSRGPLAGSLPRDLPWIIGIVGVVLTASAAVVAVGLIRRRRNAERLAGSLEIAASENRRLYAEQRSIAQTLQHALLPDRLPVIDGVQTSARYEAGEHGVDIGGDWYDVIELENRRLLLVVGDVSGRGLPAATTMASLRYAIHAYAAEDDSPAEILTKLSYLVSIAESGQLATILCALVDVDRREVSISSAGHLPPLLLSNGDGRYLESEIGLPIGVEAGASYSATTISAPRAATFVAFTDGLVEQRGEDLDQGLARLRRAATGGDAGLPELLSKLVHELTGGPSGDDIAIVGLRWTS